MSKHTPGPWHLEELYDKDTIDGGSLPVFNVCADSKDAFGQWGLMADYRGCRVAAVLCNPAVEAAPEWEIIEANARLIAAAPELLAELKRAAQGLRNLVELGLLESMYAKVASLYAEQYDMVIAKAEGAACPTSTSTSEQP